MKKLVHLITLASCVALSWGGIPSAFAAKRKIHILATGGTIAGKQTAPGEVGYKSGEFKVEDLINAVPGIRDLATITGEQVVNIGSQDMNDAVWLKLAKRIDEIAKKGDVDGIVVTHGTDTLEETSFFIDLVAKTDKPIVFVGSMRPATAVSADGPGNLYNAVAVAADPTSKGRGALVVLNDTIHDARNVVKTNTTSLETFQSLMRGPMGLVTMGKIKWLDDPGEKHKQKARFDVANVAQLPRVDVIYAHANMSTDLITAAVKNGAKGLVVAGVGDGNMTEQAQETLASVAKQGVVVVRSTRLPEGIVLRNAEVNDDERGFVASGEFTPPKARVLLQFSLMKTQDPKEIQKIFDVG